MSKDEGSPPEAPPAENGYPVTIIRTRRAKRGKEKEVEEVLTGMIQAASTFPGHRGAKLLRPANPDEPEYQVVFTFDTPSHFDEWEKSETRNRWMERLRPLMEREYRTHVLTGLETWFTLPVPSAGFVPPPRYKMALATWLGIYPLVTLLIFLLTALPVGRAPGLLPYLFGPLPAPLPQLLSPLVMTGILVFLMTYVVMPRLTYLLRRWLYPRGPR